MATKKTKAAPKEKVAKEEAVKELSYSPFDYVKAIQQSKVDIIRTSDNPALAEKQYKPFLANKALSFHVDSILHVNEMNLRHSLDNIQQFDYLINTVRSMRRPHIWLKKETDEDVQFLQDTFQMNNERAREAYAVLGSEKVAELRKSIVTGGVVGKK